MFKTRAIVIDFLGDQERYGPPTGIESAMNSSGTGRAHREDMPSLATLVVPKLIELHAAGPRIRGPLYYYPFLYAPRSVEDPGLKKYDGLGFRNVFEAHEEPDAHMANLALFERI